MSFFHRHESISATPSGIHIESIKGDRPKFERVYTSRLDDRASVKVSIKFSYSGGLSKSGELTQPNGRWVLFDPDAIADKILDPALVPLVRGFVDEIYAADRAYRNGGLAEFIDEAGVKWRRTDNGRESQS